MSDSILDEVLRVATIADVLKLAGETPPASEKKPILCPLHAERSPSFYIQSSGKGFRCHGCNAHGGVVELVVALKIAPDKTGAINALAEHYKIEKPQGSGARSPRSRRAAAFSITRPAAPKVSPMTHEERDELAAALQGCVPVLGTLGADYLKGRGFESDAAHACEVRFHPNWLRHGAAIIFGGRDETGRLVTAQGRYIQPTDGVKTRSKGKVSLGVFSTTGALAMARDGLDGPVAIVEAPLCALALASTGLPAIALFGASNRQAWLRQKLAMSDVVLAMDNDNTGRNAAAELCSWLNLGTSKATLELAPAKDPAELLQNDPQALLYRVAEVICRVRSRYWADDFAAAA